MIICMYYDRYCDYYEYYEYYLYNIFKIKYDQIIEFINY